MQQKNTVITIINSILIASLCVMILRLTYLYGYVRGVDFGHKMGFTQGKQISDN